MTVFERIKTQDLHHLKHIGDGNPPNADKVRALIRWVQQTAKPITDVCQRDYIRRMLLVWEVHLYNATGEPIADVAAWELIGWERRDARS
jgi:hypothetical protein